MADTWYEIVEAGSPLTQGDFIFGCPVLAWQSGTLELEGRRETEVLQGATIATASDVVVMTQACDLEHKNVENVILCPHVSLSEHHTNWKENMENASQKPISFLESLIEKRGIPRFRLLPPYREHLSQAFARFFMRVGLPIPIEKDWTIEETA